MPTYPIGVLTGSEAMAVFQDAKDKGFALPAINVFSFSCH